MTDVNDSIVELANATAYLLANNRDALAHRRAFNALKTFFQSLPADPIPSSKQLVNEWAALCVQGGDEA